jgi:phosphonate transport system permease protein
VLENVLAGALREVSTARALFNAFPDPLVRKACTLLGDLGLTEDMLQRRASELSGGQQQRVAIARAFILDPAVVLADEPVASLDVAMSEIILRLLREMSARRGTAVLCSLHQVELARQFADRVVAMRSGQVIADGPPAEIDDAESVRIYSRAPGPPGSGPAPPPGRPPSEWALPQPFGKGAIAIALVAVALLGLSAQRTQIPLFFSYTAEWIAAGLGLKSESHIGKGLGRFASGAFPMRFAEETAVGRMEGYPDHLPLFARVESRDKATNRYDFDQKKMVETVEHEQVVVEPLGYLFDVCAKVLVSLQVALWGTLFALVLSIPLAICGARGYTPNRLVYLASRLTSSFLRSIPELVSALILVLAFGLGPMAGIVALALHSAGFLGKFYADDIENADRAPQEALFAVGANRLKVLRHAVLPQVLPQYIAYTQYILERNVRMATAIGVVGAGGIFDTFEFDRVSTILLVIFVTVLILEQLSQRLRARLIRIG